ncbi:putative cytochrome P450 [Xylariaceae sp. FL0662B]|nr:putative cytochrome P450 [Xylariaceae sp. FL0662B]
MYYTAVTIAFSLLSIELATILSRQHGDKNLARPPLLHKTIPFILNAWEKVLKTNPIVRCRIGPMTLHFVTGGQNISALFGSSFSSDPWVLRILGKSGGYASSDIEKFSQDHSGRRPVSAFASAFQDFFNQELAAFPVGTWVEEVYILDFLKQRLSTAATKAVLGPRIIDANPNFMEVFWRYERFVEPLAFGLLTSLNRQGRQARDQFRDMCYRWYRLAIQEFKSDDIISCNNLDWEPAFGSLVSRKLAWWVKSFDFSAQSQGAAFSLFLFGLHANTIPISAWIIMELIRDPELFRAVREEVAQANEGTNNESLNHEKVASLPLLQSIYTEVLRLHVRVLITRTSHEPVTIAGYNLPKGSIVQAPTEVGHLDEAVWDTPGHPASEFWGYRHVRETETIGDEGRVLKRLQFSLEGKAGSFFPFAGNSSILLGKSRCVPE